VKFSAVENTTSGKILKDLFLIDDF
jgi:hypothetical protein